MNKVLLTGGTGYIGRNIAKRLLDEGYEISLIVRKTSNMDFYKKINDRIKINIYNGNITKLKQFFNQVSPDYVIHLASFFSAQHEEGEIIPLVESNILFGTQILEASRNCGVKFFINTGTHWQHYDLDAYNPICLYAATKKAFEDIAKYYLETSDLRMLTIKIIDTFGPYDQRPKVLNLFKKIALSGEHLDMSPGNQELGLVYIDDIATAYIRGIEMIKTMNKGELRSVVAAPKKVYTLKEVARIFEKASGKKLNINWGKKPYRNREMMKIWTGESNILSDIETVDLIDGIKRIISIEKSMEGE